VSIVDLPCKAPSEKSSAAYRHTTWQSLLSAKEGTAFMVDRCTVRRAWYLTRRPLGRCWPDTRRSHWRTCHTDVGYAFFGQDARTCELKMSSICRFSSETTSGLDQILGLLVLPLFAYIPTIDKTTYAQRPTPKLASGYEARHVLV
jgi:hypothetical protein